MELQSKEPAPAAGLERDEALAAARHAIHELEPKEREVFLLRTSAELSFQDTAEALSIPIGTAKTRMRAALARLRRSLWAHMPKPPQPAPSPQPAPAVQPIRRLDDLDDLGNIDNIDIKRTGRRKTS